MIVKELIEKLQMMDPNLEVKIHDNDGDGFRNVRCYEKLQHKDFIKDWEYEGMMRPGFWYYHEIYDGNVCYRKNSGCDCQEVNICIIDCIL